MPKLYTQFKMKIIEEVLEARLQLSINHQLRETLLLEPGLILDDTDSCHAMALHLVQRYCGAQKALFILDILIENIQDPRSQLLAKAKVLQIALRYYVLMDGMKAKRLSCGT